MTKIALITDSENPYLTLSDKLLIPEFKKVNISAIPVVWEDEKQDLTLFDAIIIRNTWDYFLKVEKFKTWLRKIEAFKIPVFNSPQHIIENMHKFYLKKMAQKGIDIIPTIFKHENVSLDPNVLLSLKADKVIFKPAISAGSYQTKLFSIEEALKIADKYKGGDWLIQPFISEIKEMGEVSLIYFNRKFKYAIHKKAKNGDFRVQYQFGGTYSIYYPTKTQLEAAQKVLETIEGDLLFARIDGVMVENRFLLMEIEIIEPDLYFNIYEPAAGLFVDATLELLATKK